MIMSDDMSGGMSDDDKRSDDNAGDGPRRFEASIDRAEQAAAVHCDRGGFAAVVPDARHVSMGFASQGLSGDRSHRLGEVRLLQRRIYPGLGLSGASRTYRTRSPRPR